MQSDQEAFFSFTIQTIYSPTSSATRLHFPIRSYSTPKTPWISHSQFHFKQWPFKNGYGCCCSAWKPRAGNCKRVYQFCATYESNNNIISKTAYKSIVAAHAGYNINEGNVTRGKSVLWMKCRGIWLQAKQLWHQHSKRNEGSLCVFTDVKGLHGLACLKNYVFLVFIFFLLK